tara:strand:+ start:42575 stop:43417 length:843 start_codon:yes stop_codon:yes gene_type:complete
MRKICIILLLTLITSAAFADTDDDGKLKKSGWIYTPTTYAHIMYQNRKSSFIESNMMVPFWEDERNVTYAKLQNYMREGPRQTIGFGVGWNHLTQGRQAIFGVNAFYDRLRSFDSKLFSQVIVGAQAQTTHWVYQAHVYQPVVDTHVQVVGGPSMQSFQNVQLRDGLEQIMPGFDAQVGYRIGRNVALETYLGGYYFSAHGAQTVTGPQAHIVFSLQNPFGFSGIMAFLARNVAFEVGTSYDKPNDFSWYGGIRWTVGLGKQDLTGMEWHMMDENRQLFD